MKMANKLFENVANLIYLGMALTNKNSMHEEKKN
jgi:hypothetical protein